MQTALKWITTVVAFALAVSTSVGGVVRHQVEPQIESCCCAADETRADACCCEKAPRSESCSDQGCSCACLAQPMPIVMILPASGAALPTPNSDRVAIPSILSERLSDPPPVPPPIASL